MSGGVTSVTFTSYNVIGGVITLTASVVVADRSSADMSSFSYSVLAGATSYDPATPTSQVPASGTQTSDFTLTFTFSELSFPPLYTNSQNNRYRIYYETTLVATAIYQYVGTSATFSFTSFTVSQLNLQRIQSYAEFSYSDLNPPNPELSNFTYTISLGGTTYSYTNGTPSNFTPTLSANTFLFTFSNTVANPNFPQFFVLSTQTHTLNFTNTQLISNSSPVTFTYSDTFTFTFNSFSLALAIADSTIIRNSFSYSYAGITPALSNFEYYLNLDVLDSASYITWNISQSGGSGTGTAEFSRLNQVTAPLFLQGSANSHLVKFNNSNAVSYTSTISTVFTISNSSNIQLTNPININFLTINNYKSIMLPPAASSKGLLFHFKTLSITSPYTFRLVPSLKNDFLPLQTNLYTTTITNPFASQIEGAYAPSILTSTLNTFTHVSDGTNWWILNKYLGSLTPNSVASLPSPVITESTETASFNYNYVTLANRNNIVLHSMSYSYLKYIFITNAYETSVTFNIYFPSGSGLETLTSGDGETYKYLSFTLPTGKVGGLVLTYSDNRYYVISSAINPSITPAFVSLETPLTISSSISRLITGEYFELPYLSNISSSNAVLTIIKAGTGTKQVNASQNVHFQLVQEVNAAFELVTNSVVWFIIIKNGNDQYYLPVSFYPGS